MTGIDWGVATRWEGKPREVWGDSLWKKPPVVPHTENWELAMDWAIQVLQVTLTLESNFEQELGTKA